MHFSLAAWSDIVQPTRDISNALDNGHDLFSSINSSSESQSHRMDAPESIGGTRNFLVLVSIIASPELMACSL